MAGSRNDQGYPPPGPYPPPQNGYATSGYPPPQQGGYGPPQGQQTSAYPPPAGQQPYMQPPPPQGMYPPQQGYGPQDGSAGYPNPQPNPPYYGPPHQHGKQQGWNEGAGGAAAPPPMQAVAHGPSGNIFPEKTGFRDPVFIFLFLLHLVGVVVLITIQALADDAEDSVSSGDTTSEVVPIIGAVLFLAAVFGIVWLFLMQRFPLQMIWISLIGQVVFLAVVCLWAFASGNIGLGIIALIFTAISVIWIYLVRRMIPFSAALLGMSTSLVKRYPATIYVALVFLVVNIIWFCIWGYAITLNSTKDGSTWAFLYLLFSFFWTTQVLKNIVHTSVSGSIATWYFLSHTASMPPNPTMASLKRACGKSFGSICMGSLLVAIVKFIRALVRMALRDQNGLFACLINWIMGVLDYLIELFNQYAFVHVAVYGKKFMDAAKDTWSMVKEKGVDILVNDNLTGAALMMGCLIGGVLCGMLGYVWAHSLHEDNKITFDSVWMVTVAAFVIGFVLVAVMLSPVESTIATIFVCYAEDPATLRQASSEFYGMITEAEQARSGNPRQ